MIVTLWSRLFDPKGTERELDWPELVALLYERAEFLGGDQHPGWSPAWFDPCERAKENVRAVYAACFDFDKGESMATVLERVGVEVVIPRSQTCCGQPGWSSGHPEQARPVARQALKARLRRFTKQTPEPTSTL